MLVLIGQQEALKQESDVHLVACRFGTTISSAGIDDSREWYAHYALERYVAACCSRNYEFCYDRAAGHSFRSCRACADRCQVACMVASCLSRAFVEVELLVVAQQVALSVVAVVSESA